MARNEYYKQRFLRRDWILLRDWLGKQPCKCCGASGVDLHHQTYRRFGMECPKDLVPLCRRCHDRVHRMITRRGWNVSPWSTKIAIKAVRNGITSVQAGIDKVARDGRKLGTKP